MEITTGSGLRLLSFDGGGARALSQIIIMANIMHRIQCDTNPDKPDEEILPCKCFDLIGGSDTGGTLAIMFGKLSMSVNEVYDEFERIHAKVYAGNLSAEERTRRLRSCIEGLLKSRGFSPNTKLQGDGGCSCFVVATHRLNMKTHTKLRSYISRASTSSDVTVVDAILATCATQPFFLPVSVGHGGRRQELIGGAIGMSNPCDELFTEAGARFKGNQKISTILSIGSGLLGVFPAPLTSGVKEWTEVLGHMVSNSERTAQEMEKRLGGRKFYFRFSVEQGLQPNHDVSVNDPLWINTQTEAYLDDVEVSEKMDSCVESIRSRLDKIELKDLGGVRASKISHAFELQNQLANEKDKEILKSLKSADVKQDMLPEGCMGGTRQDILQEIEEWIEDTGSKNILWITGHPGVGKSALASSVVGHLRQKKRLGSSFFFRRAEADSLTAHAMWRFIAYELASRYPSIRKDLAAKLDADRDIPTTGSIEELFRKLIREPLEASSNIDAALLPVVVVDALDECGGLDGQHSQHRQNLLLTIERWSSLPRKFKLIVTSRGEHDIGSALEKVSHVIEISTGLNVSDQSSTDVKTFMISRFKQIAIRNTALPHGWPGDQVIDALTQRASGLFIWARLVTEFVSRGEPEEQLSIIQQGDSGDGMPALYSQILSIAFQKATSGVLEAFRAIIGAIVFLKRPLSSKSMARLLSIKDTRIHYICNLLKPIVEIKNAVQITHQSFVDFLLNSKTCPPSFHIKQGEEEERLLRACFRTMKAGLKFNICGLESSYLLNREVEDLDERIQRSVPNELTYSSHHWISHLSACRTDIDITGDLQQFLEVDFLYWLEILSLMKQVNTATGILSSLVNWMKEHNGPYEVATELQKFVNTFASVISQSVPHIYISALPFSPQTSTIFKFYMPLYRNSLIIEAGGLERWPIFQNVMYGHSQEVQSVGFSPDGRRIVSGAQDSTLRVWDAETGETVAGPFKGHLNSVRGVAFSPDGNRIASGSDDGTILIWDSKTTEVVVGPLYGHTSTVSSIAFSPDGHHVVSGSYDGMLRVWDVETNDIVGKPFQGHAGWVHSVAFSPDGRWIASGSDDKSVRLWSTQTGKATTAPFMGHSQAVVSVSFSPDGRRIVSGSWDKTIRIWDMETGNTVAGPFEGHSDLVQAVAFSPDGCRIVSGSYDKTVRVWDAETGEILSGPFEGHTDYITSVAFSPDGLRVVSGSDDRTVRVWGVDISERYSGRVTGPTSYIAAITFSPDGSKIVSGSNDCTLRLWDAATGEAITEPFRGHSGRITSVAFSPDGRRIASGSSDCTVKIWDDMSGGSYATSFDGHTNEISRVAFSPNGQQVISAGRDDILMAWDSKTGEVAVEPFERPHGLVRSIAFSPNGQWIVAISDDYTIRIWELNTGKAVAGPFIGHTGRTRAVAFSPSGTHIISGSQDETIRVWSLENGECSTRPFKGHHALVWAIAFSPDVRWMVSGSGDNTLRIWDVETGRSIMGPFIGHTQTVATAVFSLDGQKVASTSDDRTVRVWESHPSSTDISPFTISSSLIEGWILDSQGRRLFWVPAPLRDGLLRPGAVSIVGEMIKTKLNLDYFVYGEAWASCRSSI